MWTTYTMRDTSCVNAGCSGHGIWDYLRVVEETGAGNYTGVSLCGSCYRDLWVRQRVEGTVNA